MTLWAEETGGVHRSWRVGGVVVVAHYARQAPRLVECCIVLLYAAGCVMALPRPADERLMLLG